MSDVDHSLVHSFQLCLGDIEAEDKWIEEHKDKIALVALDDPDFCSCNLVFIPSPEMGFSCYRTSNCCRGRYVGFFYPGHIATLGQATEKMFDIMERWEDD